jgi:hypothetical protein
MWMKMCAKFTDQGNLVTVDVAVFFFLFLQPFFIDSLGNTTKKWEKNGYDDGR